MPVAAERPPHLPPPPVPASTAGGEPPRHGFTTEEFYRLSDMGFFGEERVELINGDILQKMPPNPPHAVATDVNRDVIAHAFSLVDCCVRVEKPVAVDGSNDPQPDICVAEGSLRRYATAHPLASEALLLIEVSDATLEFDRDTKGPRYAQAGICEYWILNLRQRQLEVFRDAWSGVWTTQFTVPEIGTITPLAAPQSVVAVADLLP